MSLVWVALLLGCTRAPPAAPSSEAPAPQAPAAQTTEAAHKPARALYFVMVDRFHNGDPANDATIDLADPQAFHGGDLAGIRQKLDWIDELGFTDVWLTPVFEMRTEKLHEWGAFHGYWVRDPTRVEPRFGTEAELRALADDLHARNMALWLDVVWNHVGFDSPLRTEHPDWFHPSLPITDWSDATQRVTHEVHGLPDLAQENPDVYAWLLQSHIQWLTTVQPDGFRVDAVRHMPLPELQRLGTDLRAHQPDLELLGEVFDGNPAEVEAAWTGGGFDHVFDFPLRYAMIDTFCAGKSVGRLASTLSLDRTYADARQLVTFLDNHDTPRLLHECGGDDAKAAEALRFLFAVRGIPSLTWGTESGLDGGEEPANRADMRFAPHPLHDVVQSALAQRSAIPELHEGRTEVVHLAGDFLLLAQRSETGSVLVAVNHTGAPYVWSDVTFAPGVSVLDRPAPPALSGTRRVVVQGSADRLVGAGPLLGSWSADDGLPFIDGEATLEAPVGSVLSYKLVHRDGDAWRWSEGADHVVFVAPGDLPLKIDERPR